MRVLILDSVHALLLKGLRQMGFEIVEDYQSAREDIQQKLSGIQGLIIRSRFPIDQEFLAHATDLQFIGRVGAGMENIDIEEAGKRGIKLFKAPEGNRDAVGEHALGMLLMLLNNLAQADREVRQGKWKREENRGHELQGKTVGIIGYGQMGSAFAEKLRGFGVEVLAYDKYKTGFGNEWVREVALEEIFEKAAIVSLHVPQTSETIGMVNQKFLNQFKEDIYLINTARGKVVQTAALVEALQSGKLQGACLDVLEYEKSSFEELFSGGFPEDFRYLVNSDKVVLSPHIAGWSYESNEKMARVLLGKIKNLKL